VLLDHHRRACLIFAGLVAAIGPEQWGLPTPCADWDVRTLVNHVVSWKLIVVELLAGRTPAAIAPMFGRDALGHDPVVAANASVDAAIAAFAVDTPLDSIVHHPFGDLPWSYVIMMRVFDNMLHGWDLARAIGADERIDAELVAAVFEWASPQSEALHASGAFAPVVEVPPDADSQTRLLALVGRRALAVE